MANICLLISPPSLLLGFLVKVKQGISHSFSDVMLC